MYALSLTEAEGKILRNIVESANPNKPYTLADVRRGVDILKRLDEAFEAKADAPAILLEKEEHAFIKRRLDDTQWLRAGADILALYDKVANAEDVKVQAAPKPNGADHQPQANG